MVVAISFRQWQSLVDATGIAPYLPTIEAALDVDLSQEGDRFEARDAIASFIGPWVASARSRRSGTPSTSTASAGGRIRRSASWWPMTGAARPTTRSSTRDTNPVSARSSSPARRSAMPSSTTTPTSPPLLGQHTLEVFGADLGLSDADLQDLLDRGVIAGADSSS